MLIQTARTKIGASSGTEDDSWLLVCDFLWHILGRISSVWEARAISHLVPGVTFVFEAVKLCSDPSHLQLHMALLFFPISHPWLFNLIINCLGFVYKVLCEHSLTPALTVFVLKRLYTTFKGQVLPPDKELLHIKSLLPWPNQIFYCDWSDPDVSLT